LNAIDVKNVFKKIFHVFLGWMYLYCPQETVRKQLLHFQGPKEPIPGAFWIDGNNRDFLTGQQDKICCLTPINIAGF
jgi:hypothetical protein